MTATKDAYDSEVKSDEEQRKKVGKENVDAVNKLADKLDGLMKQGEKADMSAMLTALKDYTNAVESYLDQNTAHRNKEEKLDNQHIVNLKKTCANYEKESKGIKSEIDKHEAEADSLESQIRKVVLSYQKTAVQIDKKQLQTDLNKVLEAFP
jgi:hypothetical protein